METSAISSPKHLNSLFQLSETKLEPNYSIVNNLNNSDNNIMIQETATMNQSSNDSNNIIKKLLFQKNLSWSSNNGDEIEQTSQSNNFYASFQSNSILPNATFNGDQQQNNLLLNATTLESLENYLVSNSKNESTMTTSEFISITNDDSNDMRHCFKFNLFNNETQSEISQSKLNISKTNDTNICPPSSSESELSSQHSPPSALLTDITQETITFEHTDDFIRSLQIPLDVLDDLTSRFILNMPQEEKYDPIRICFQMENAFWHYLDFCYEHNNRLPKFKFKRFAQIMFTYVPRLRQFLDVFDDIINKWIQYKFSIPCSGAIMLDETMNYILLVQGYGNNTWGFPKGKLNHDESLMNCAVREVFEETGYNCMGNIFEEQYLERKVFESRLRLFLIRNVEFNYDFKPQARNEIRSIKWFALKDFPQHRPDQQQSQQKSSSQTTNNSDNDNDNLLMPQNARKFLTVIPFIPAIRKWVENEKRKLKLAKKREQKQQMKLAKQQKKADELMNNLLTKNEHKCISLGSCSPISSTNDEINDNDKSNAIDDDSDDQSFNQSTTFVDVDLNNILGYREMYNCKNDQRKNLMTREQRNNEQIRQKQMSLLSDANNKFLPQAGHLEDIERALIENSTKQIDNNKISQSPISSLLLGSKDTPCKDKLNILFGLANQSSSMISTYNQRPLSSLSVNSPNCNDIDMGSIMKKSSIAPIGTKRSSSISGDCTTTNSGDNIDANLKTKFSGHTVISTGNNYSDNSKNVSSNGPNSDIETSLNNLTINSATTPKNNSNKQPLSLKTCQVEYQQRIFNSGDYNGLNDETVQMIHPKIEQLLQQLKAVNMA